MQFSSQSQNSGPALYPPECLKDHGSLPTSHDVFSSLEKAFDPHGILWGLLHEYQFCGPLLPRAVWALYNWSRSMACIASRKSVVLVFSECRTLIGLPFPIGYWTSVFVTAYPYKKYMFEQECPSVSIALENH